MNDTQRKETWTLIKTNKEKKQGGKWYGVPNPPCPPTKYPGWDTCEDLICAPIKPPSDPPVLKPIHSFSVLLFYYPINQAIVQPCSFFSPSVTLCFDMYPCFVNPSFIFIFCPWGRRTQRQLRLALYETLVYWVRDVSGGRQRQSLASLRLPTVGLSRHVIGQVPFAPRRCRVHYVSGTQAPVLVFLPFALCLTMRLTIDPARKRRVPRIVRGGTHSIVHL